MAIKVIELEDSRRLTGVSTFTWKYLVTGTNTIDTVADAVFLTAPLRYGFWVRNWAEKSIVPAPGGGGAWIVEVPYNVGTIPLINLDPGGKGGQYTPPSPSTFIGPEWSVDFSAGNVRQTKSKSLVGGVGYDPNPGGTPFTYTIAPNAGGAPIGYNKETGVVEGLDVPQGVQKRELTLKIAGVTTNYLKLLENRAFNVNQEAFLDRQPGEVRFEGHRLNSKFADGVSVTLTFGITKNIVNHLVGRFVVLPQVDGWDYVEPIYTWVKDPDYPTKFIRECFEARIHRVHDRSDLWEIIP